MVVFSGCTDSGGDSSPDDFVFSRRHWFHLGFGRVPTVAKHGRSPARRSFLLPIRLD